jgi:hypothetical protein
MIHGHYMNLTLSNGFSAYRLNVYTNAGRLSTQARCSVLIE